MHVRVRKAELARKLGVSRQAVHDLVQRGVLSEDKDGLIDAEMAKIAIAQRVRPSSKTAQALNATEQTAAQPSDDETTEQKDSGPVSYHVAKAMREAAEARIAQIKLAELKGEMIKTEAVRSGLASLLASTRDRLMQLPARLAPVLAAEDDPTRVHDIVADEIHHALSQLASAPEAVGLKGAQA